MGRRKRHREGELTPRQAMLLGLIVREHVRTAAPVASGGLVRRYGLEISSATVRNEMARLEEMGYLWQPHTSAGRVPTEAGFRYFVERLMEEQTLSPEEQRTIAHQFYQARHRVELWPPLAASILATRTQSAAVVTAPRAVNVRYKHLELIATHGRAVLLVLVLQGGTVEQQMLVLNDPMSQPTLREAADRLNQVCYGLAADQIAARLRTLPPLEQEIGSLVVSMMRKLKEQPSEEIYHHGLPQLLQAPEFAEVEESSAGLVRVLEERSLLQAVIADALSPNVEIGSVRVLIGGEGKWDELRACSMILTRYGSPTQAVGTVGVLGPIRMAYGRAISVLRFVSGLLSELVEETYAPVIAGEIDTETQQEV